MALNRRRGKQFGAGRSFQGLFQSFGIWVESNVSEISFHLVSAILGKRSSRENVFFMLLFYFYRNLRLLVLKAIDSILPIEVLVPVSPTIVRIC